MIFLRIVKLQLIVVPIISISFNISFAADAVKVSDEALINQISPNYYHKGKGTPAEFITSSMGYFNEVVRAIHLLNPQRMNRDYFNFGATQSDARNVIKQFIKNAQRGFNWKAHIKKIKIPYSPNSNPDWSKSLTFRGTMPIDSDTIPSGNDLFKITYDAQFVYFKINVQDKLIVTDKNRPYLKDSVEIFIRCDLNMYLYWEIVAAPDCTPLVALHCASPRTGLRNSQYNVKPGELKVTVDKTTEGFQVMVKFPLSALFRLNKPLPYKGAKFSFMLVRTDWNGNSTTKNVPVPLLYDGHNIYGYITATLN